MRKQALIVAAVIGQGWAGGMPYGLGAGTDLPLLAGLTAMKYHSGSLLSETRAANPWSPALDRASIPAYDRWVIGRYSPSLSSLSSVVGGAGLLMPIATNFFDGYSDAASWGNLMVDAVILQEAVILTGAMSSYAKSVRLHSTPISYDPSVPESEKRIPQNASSFFSNHTATAFTTAVFSAYTFQLRHGDSPLVPWAWGGSLALATGVGALRILAGKHFPSDVAAGALAGAISGYLLPRMHLRRAARGQDAEKGDGGAGALDWGFGLSVPQGSLAAGPAVTIRF